MNATSLNGVLGVLLKGSVLQMGQGLEGILKLSPASIHPEWLSF